MVHFWDHLWPWDQLRLGIICGTVQPLELWLDKIIPVIPEIGPVFSYLSRNKKIPFCVSSALRAADLGFLLSVKCLESGGCGPTMATSADLFK